MGGESNGVARAKSDRPPDFPQKVRGGRILRSVGIAVGCTVAFALAAAGGLLLHLGVPPVRRIVRSELNTVLARSVAGTVSIERLAQLSLGGVGGVDLEVRDPSGERVLVVRGLQARVNAAAALWSALFGDGDIVVPLPDVSVAHAEPLVDQTPDGELRLARALALRNPSSPDPKGRAIGLALPHIALGHAWIHGRIGAGPPLDVELQRGALSALVTSEVKELEVTQLRVTVRGVTVVPSTASLRGGARLPSRHEGERVDASLRVDGLLGDVAIAARAAIDGKRVSLAVDVPRNDAAALHTIVASPPVHVPFEAHLEAHGELPRVEAQAVASVGTGVVRVGAAAIVQDGLRADANAEIDGVDLRAFSPSSSPSRISAEARLNIATTGGSVRGSYALSTRDSTFGRQPLPPVRVAGAFTPGAITGAADIAERGAPTRISFAARRGPGEAKFRVSFDANSEIADLTALTRLAPAVYGSVSAHSYGELDLARGTIDAMADVHARHLSKGTSGTNGAALAARLSGPFAAPALDARLRATGLHTMGMVFDEVDVTARGPARSARVAVRLAGEHAPRLDAHATVDIAGGLGLRDVALDVTRGGTHAVARVAHMRAAGGAFVADDVAIEGLGAPMRASFGLHPSRARLRLDAPDVDLERVSDLLGDDRRVGQGHAAFDLVLAARPHDVRGYLCVSLREANLPSLRVEGASASIDARFAGRRASADAELRIDQVGHARLRAKDVTLGPTPASPRSWRQAAGSAEFEGEMNLSGAQKMWSLSQVEHMVGSVRWRLGIARSRPHASPDAELDVQTGGLDVIGHATTTRLEDGTAVRQMPPWHLAGVDVGLHATVDGATERAALSAQVRDQAAEFASLRAEGPLLLTRLLSAPRQALEAMKRLPVRASLELPARRLESWPLALRPQALKGTAALTVRVDGSAMEPRLQLRGVARDLVRTDLQRPAPFDLDVQGGFAQDRAVAKAVVRSENRQVADADAELHVAVTDVLNRGARKPSRWYGSGAVHLRDLPLAGLVSRTRGRVTGDIVLRDLHRDAKLSAALEASGAQFRDVVVPRVVARANIDQGSLQAHARIEQSDGSADAKMTAAVRWGDAITPAFDETRAVDLTYDVQRLRASLFHPFVRDTFSNLDGRIDGHGTVHIEPNRAGGNMEGDVALSRGRFEIPTLGEEFHDVRVRARIQPWGTLRVDDVFARGVTGGQLKASAQGQLDGFRLDSIKGELDIERGEALPLSFEGVSMGEAWGKIRAMARMTADGSRLDAIVDVPVLHVDLPQSSAHPVQPLTPAPDIHVGVFDPDEGFVTLPLGPPKNKRSETSIQYHLAFNLGNDVVIRRDTSLRAALEGRPEVTITDEAYVSGAIRLTRGALDVFGKRFEIERGVITFTGEASNPTVVATAFWTAPEGTKVYADFTGPIKSGKLELRSEPARSKDEIIALILFGSAQGSVGATPPPGQDSGAVGRAAGLAGGLVTQGLNRVLSGVSPVEITTKVDTTQAQNPRPEIAVQITDDVTAQVAYNLGLPQPGQNPDRTLLTFDYRFLRNWSVTTTVGDRGSTIADILWNYRY